MRVRVCVDVCYAYMLPRAGADEHAHACIILVLVRSSAPAQEGGVPASVLKHARAAAQRIRRQMQRLETGWDARLAALRRRRQWSSSGKVKGRDMDDWKDC